MIHIKINPKYSHLESYLRQLTVGGTFNEGGEILYNKRNIVKLFEVNGLSKCHPIATVGHQYPRRDRFRRNPETGYLARLLFCLCLFRLSSGTPRN